MRIVTGHDRLVRSALQLKKACLMAALLAGHKLTEDEAMIPAYARWTRRRLQQHVVDLEADLGDALGVILAEPPRRVSARVTNWLTARFEEWAAAGFGLLVVSTTQEFEENVGGLRATAVLDVPPYAQVLLQPGIDVAFRHPEYMLSRDLSLLYDLFRDAEELLASVDWNRPPQWAPAASENALALGRATVQCCFNLLEAFVNGLARAHAMMTPNLDKELAASLHDTQSPLRRRIIRIPSLIRGESPKLDINRPPFSILFGDIKMHRDSYVHCEPGPMESQRGYVKEEMFHDAFAPVVGSAFDSTCEIIRLVWHHVHSRGGPAWLHDREENGRSARRNLRLSPEPGV
jgi:hypothetical protein